MNPGKKQAGQEIITAEPLSRHFIILYSVALQTLSVVNAEVITVIFIRIADRQSAAVRSLIHVNNPLGR